MLLVNCKNARGSGCVGTPTEQETDLGEICMRPSEFLRAAGLVIASQRVDRIVVRRFGALVFSGATRQGERAVRET